MLLEKFKQKKFLLLFIVIFEFIVISLSLIQPLILKDVINHIKSGSFEIDWLFFSVLLILFFNVSSAILNVGVELFYKIKFSEKIVSDIRNQLYLRIVHMKMSSLKDYSHGELIQITSSDLNYIRRFLNNGFLNVLKHCVTIIVVIIIMFYQSWQLTIVSIVIFPLMAYLSYRDTDGIEKRFEDLDNQESIFNQTVQESIEGVRVVRAFNRRKYHLNKFKFECQKLYDISFDLNKKIAKKWMLQDGLYYLQLLLLIIFGVYFSINDIVSVGLFVAFYNYIEHLLWPVRELGRFFSKISQLFVASKRIKTVLEKEIESQDYKNLDFDNYDILFKDVKFDYDGENQILNNVNLSIKQGEKVAIIGKTGSGKSTLISILLRLYDYSGSITIGGHELRDIPLFQYRNILGSVMQDPLLFTMSVKENVITNQDMDNDLLDKVILASSMTEFIHKFTNGLDTLVGEKGVTLSGGQKQRTALARSLYRKPQILLLDDALSAVDNKTDQAIQQHFKDLNCSLILITHRLSTAAKMDKIFVLDQGSIVACGTHKQLLENCRQYQAIASLQQMEF